MSRGRLRLWFASVFDVLRLPVNLSSSLVYLRPRTLRFAVTPKGRTGDNREICGVPRLLRFLRAAVLASWAYGTASLLGVTPTEYSSVPAVATRFVLWSKP